MFQTPNTHHCLQSSHYISILIIWAGNPPKYLLYQIMIQPEQQPSINSIYIEVHYHQKTSYLNPPLKVHNFLQYIFNRPLY